MAQHLRWIMQKDLLGQDVFLIGPPGPLRRSIAMQYLVSTHFVHLVHIYKNQTNKAMMCSGTVHIFVVDQELTKREVEYVALSRDTTETDLKQRREIRSGTAFYIDQVSLLSV